MTRAPAARPLDRAASVTRLESEPFDLLVVGGGATGLGTAVDAALRGYRTALIEAADFAKATSSRSTKLVHGGVRYLQSGEIGLVREALHERTLLRSNAPHLVHDLGFVLPTFDAFATAYYAAGLTAYDLLAGRSDFGRSRILGKSGVLARVPNVDGQRLFGGVEYHDGQFDDARLAIALARTAAENGAVVANYVRAERFVYDCGRIAGVVAADLETGIELTIRATVVVNATGIFVDTLRALDVPDAPPLLALSRGTHLVFDRAVLGADWALMIPKTDDGRVLFAIPWHDRVVVGTTDIPAERAELDPTPAAAEIDYLLEHLNRYVHAPVGRSDIRAAFAGLRPLVNHSAVATTAKLSREHTIETSTTGLITVTGGKWTTYRRMAQDVVDAAGARGTLPPRPCVTAQTLLHGAGTNAEVIRLQPAADALRVYGTDAPEIDALAAADPALAVKLDDRLPYTRAHAVYAVRAEMARTVDDVLARRTRALFLDEAASLAAAPDVARIIGAERGMPAEWIAAEIAGFGTIARGTEASVASIARTWRALRRNAAE
ncbi:MAG: glycerol-3-phosphate dehydrogenase/oxidase [Candidatus Velthaea sp.]|jgi:glycerol-3-phosphate dehydrogenase